MLYSGGKAHSRGKERPYLRYGVKIFQNICYSTMKRVHKVSILPTDLPAFGHLLW